MIKNLLLSLTATLTLSSTDFAHYLPKVDMTKTFNNSSEKVLITSDGYMVLTKYKANIVIVTDTKVILDGITFDRHFTGTFRGFEYVATDTMLYIPEIDMKFCKDVGICTGLVKVTYE